MSSRLYSKRHKPEEQRFRKKRPKTFVTKEAAEKYAKDKKLDKYEVVPTTYSNKFIIKS